MNNKVTFKPYDINQLKLPIDLAIDISENHLVKIVGLSVGHTCPTINFVLISIYELS